MINQRWQLRSIVVFLLTWTLLMFAAGCKKKAPAPPPPPTPPKKTESTPTTPATPAGPRITNFVAEPSSIERGQSATLRWAVTGSSDISIDQGIGSVSANGTRQVFPGNTTRYNLTARGAGGTDRRSATVEVTSAPPPPPPKPKAPTVSGADMLGREARDVLFDYDKSDIREDARQALTHNADVLKRIFASSPGFSVVIEGHCDERGSAEYNLGLGDRRATAAKEFLVQLGVPADRLTPRTYGKERPLCTEANEECYQRNRRAHLSPGQ